jgi:hypothetical protein
VSSQALVAFTDAIDEIIDLGTVATPSLAVGSSRRVARAAGRAQVVLLSAHFERYFYAINEEAVEIVNARNIPATDFPDRLKLLHSRYPIDEIGETSWESRSDGLAAFISEDGWLWSGDTSGTLRHDRLLAWLRSPKPADIRRYYRYWKIEDIFTTVTRNQASRGKLWLGIQELVDMRNNIAHGDFASQPTQSDIKRYISSVCTFCNRADRAFSRTLGQLTNGMRPW